MRKTRGFRLRHSRLVTVFKWVFQRKSNSTNHQRFSSSSRTRKVMSKLCSWGRSLQRQAKGLCFSKSDSKYIRMDHDQVETKPAGDPPKGHLAVYVGESDDDTQRYMVPVIYFNHPLFGELLKEAEKVFGFNHPGGIQIPCPVSEFENVQTRIAAGESFRRRTGSRRRAHG